MRKIGSQWRLPQMRIHIFVYLKRLWDIFGLEDTFLYRPQLNHISPLKALSSSASTIKLLGLSMWPNAWACAKLCSLCFMYRWHLSLSRVSVGIVLGSWNYGHVIWTTWGTWSPTVNETSDILKMEYILTLLILISIYLRSSSSRLLGYFTEYEYASSFRTV